MMSTSSTATADTTLSSIARYQPRTESQFSPFFFRGDDPSTPKPPSIRFSTVSSFSSYQEQPTSPTGPQTPKEPLSWSTFARRQWSRLSQVADDDADSVVSEPASYSHSAYVASDLWLVQNDVPNAEKEITERGRRKREKVSQMPQRSWTAEYRNDETPSSRLISQFFSGRNTPSVGPVRQDRMDGVYRCGSRNCSATRTGIYERGSSSRDRDDRFPKGRFERWEDRDNINRERFQFRNPRPQFQEQDFGPFVRRRFSRARKLRWWLRRVTHRVRDDWEYDM